MSEVTKEQALEAIELLSAYVNGGEAAAGEETTSVTIPTVEEVSELSKDDLFALATKLGIDTENVKKPVLSAGLTTLAKVASDTEVEDDDEINDLAELLGLTPDKKVAKTTAAIKEWVEGITSGSGSTSTEEDASGAETDPESPEDTDGGDAAAPSDDPAVAAAAEADLPDTKTMIAHLTAYNGKADEEIEFNKKDPEEGYRALLAKLYSDSGEIAEWGSAYSKDSEGFCCGLPLKDIKVKGVDTAGQCAVTGKKFSWDADNEKFVPIK